MTADAGSASAAGSQALAGVRIIDFCWVGAGSYATKILADHGADVIKIESRAKVDGIRLSPPFASGEPGVNRSGYFADRNANKRSLALNMKTDRGRAIATRLVATCDVVTNNFTPGVMERFGLGYEDVRAINPRAVYLAMSLHGSTGPERDGLGYGLTISALVGLLALTALPGRLPAGTGTNYPDHVPNPTHAAFAVLAALRHQRRTGQGQFIDMAQTEPTLAMIPAPLLDQTINGVTQGPVGNMHYRYAPHGVYPCAGDQRWIAVAVETDAQWDVLVDVLDIGEHVDAAWGDAAGRHAAAASIDRVLAAATVERDARELEVQLQARGVAAGRVHDPADVLDDAQLAVRHQWSWRSHAEMGESVYTSPPFVLGGQDRLEVAAPLLGEHTREVCHELGMDDDEIDALIADEVLY